MGMTLKELLTKGEGTLSAQEAKTLAAQCRMDVETLYTLLEEGNSVCQKVVLAFRNDLAEKWNSCRKDYTEGKSCAEC